jgi:hypothetical protein
MCKAQFIREGTLQWVLLSGRSRLLETLNVNESNAGCANYFFYAAAAKFGAVPHPSKSSRIG